MVGAGVAVRKLWTSLRASLTVNGRGTKSKLAAINLLQKKKQKNRRCRNASMPPNRYDHYNYSDDDEMDNRIKRKLRKWSKFVCCVVEKSEAESQFVYVTDLYAHNIKADKEASGSSQPAVDMEMGRKSACCEATKVDEVDTQAEVFIAKFYHQMQMQRQKSLGEYREMLERGAT